MPDVVSKEELQQLLDAATARGEALERALQSSRQIGIAIGIVMERHRLTEEAALEQLKVISQHQNRKLRDIATEIGRTGNVPLV